jgi:hypothetical protein
MLGVNGIEKLSDQEISLKIYPGVGLSLDPDLPQKIKSGELFSLCRMSGKGLLYRCHCLYHLSTRRKWDRAWDAAQNSGELLNERDAASRVVIFGPLIRRK